jgi:type II secretory pathway pseudopilin PulG
MVGAVRSEEGFTIIEVLVAALILVLGAIATFGILASATIDNQRAKATQIALNKAQQEIEVLRSLSDEELVLKGSPPPPSSDEGNPDYRVNSGNGKFAIKRGSPPSEYKEMVVEGGVLYPTGTIGKGAVEHGPTHFTSGDVSGNVYRYVVWRNDPSCSPETCPGEQDYKQVIVAVKLDPKGNGGSPGGYVEVQSNFVDPEHSAADNPIPGAEGVVTAQQFFLSDTSCASSGETSRQETSGDHPLHNTLGTCASGQQTGSTLGAPDALLTGAPPDAFPGDATLPALYDYSSDYVNSPTAATAKGIQIRREATSGCNPAPEGSAPEWQVHRWVTDPMPKNFVMTSGESTGSVTIDFFTRAVSDSIYSGKLCIYLFVRREEGSPPKAKDEFLANREGGLPYWTYVPPQPNGEWWRGQWHEVLQTMKFNGPKTINEHERLGVAFSVDSSTGGDAIPLVYDHPEYRTRIEVSTTTPMEGG